MLNWMKEFKDYKENVAGKKKKQPQNCDISK